MPALFGVLLSDFLISSLFNPQPQSLTRKRCLLSPWAVTSNLRLGRHSSLFFTGDHMLRCILLLAVLILSPVIGWGATVQFTPPDTGIVHRGWGSVDLFSSGLDGTTLSGQSLSLDLVFSNGVLARSSFPDPGAFDIDLEVYTNAGIYPGFAGPTTGFLLDPNGNEIGGAMTAGRGDGSNGTFDVGLSAFTLGDLGGANGADISGVHFDTSFPSTGYTVTNAELIFSLYSQYDSVKFGTAGQLPEPSSGLLTLLVVLGFALAAFRSISRPFTTERTQRGLSTHH